MSNTTPFLSGEDVEFTMLPCIANHNWNMTTGKIYKVVSTSGTYVRVVNDIGVADGFHYSHFALYTGSQAIVQPQGTKSAHQGAMGAGNRAKARAVPVVSINDWPDEDEDTVEDDYDTRKANASVTSAGLFDKGDVLVYRDGTITQTTLTVKFCTATCVTFDETYSQAFNPDEFTMEY
jgi:hypothetical protein